MRWDSRYLKLTTTNANRALLRPHQHRACKAFVRRIFAINNAEILLFFFSARAAGWARFDEARRSVTQAGKVHCALDAAAAESSCFLCVSFFPPLSCDARRTRFFLPFRHNALIASPRGARQAPGEFRTRRAGKC